jgi:DNA-binding GntR family transcriptional regulator
MTAARRGIDPHEAGYLRLRSEIVSGRLGPNERLVEADLGETLRVGRDAVRMALVRLEQEGLVERERYRGARVRRVGIDEAIEILEARAALEEVAAARAAARVTPEAEDRLRQILSDTRRALDAGDHLAASERNPVLHGQILEIAESRTLSRLIANLNSQIVRFHYRTILVPGRPERSYQEHRAIVEAVAAHDAGAAAAAVRDHLRRVMQALRWFAGAGAAAGAAEEVTS